MPRVPSQIRPPNRDRTELLDWFSVEREQFVLMRFLPSGENFLQPHRKFDSSLTESWIATARYRMTSGLVRQYRKK